MFCYRFTCILDASFAGDVKNQIGVRILRASAQQPKVNSNIDLDVLSLRSGFKTFVGYVRKNKVLLFSQKLFFRIFL